jgi:hypothetical protein
MEAQGFFGLGPAQFAASATGTRLPAVTRNGRTGALTAERCIGSCRAGERGFLGQKTPWRLLGCILKLAISCELRQLNLFKPRPRRLSGDAPAAKTEK